MPLTVRLPPKIERALNAMARRQRQTRSEVVREAIEHYAATAERPERKLRPYEQWADVLGIARTGRQQTAGTTGEQFRNLVTRKARARRAR